MNEDTEFGYKARQILNQGVDSLARGVAGRLHDSRRIALDCQKKPAEGLRLAGIGRDLELSVLANARSLVAVMALIVGAMGTYYWNAFEQAQEYEAIDSALLADELPPSAYLDRGFQAWLERTSDSSSQ